MDERTMEALTGSIREFGVVDPIIVRLEDRTVIGGHQRLVAAQRAGLTKVPVVFLDVSEEKARLLNLALNKISGDWDEQLLAGLLADLAKMPDIDLSISGFAPDEVSSYLKKLETREKRQQIETFDLEAELESARTSTGIARGA